MATQCPRRSFALTCFALLLAASPLFADGAPRSREQMKASFEAHKGDFDYLLGDWEFTTVNQEYGKGRGFWTAVRLADGQVLDEFRIVGDKGEIYYSTVTFRAYNARLDQWELVSAESGTGLQNTGTGRREAAEVRIEQKFGSGTDKPSVLRIRYYDIGPDRFSWTADRSTDGGKTWSKDFQHIEARRIGPPHSTSLFAPQKP
jgi:hypothetical protein